MKVISRGLFILTISSSFTQAVINNYWRDLDNSSTTIWQDCWNPETAYRDISIASTSWAGCVKREMYLGLVKSVEKPIVDIGDGVTFFSEENNLINPRDMFPLGEEPSSFRGVVDAYSTFLSRRGIRWDLSHVYPGLIMRIGPTLNGDGVLEFIMDRRLDYIERAKLGPGQQMIRRTILPHLLGFRMNLLSLLPLVFGIMVYVAKNAFIFSKITLVISTLLTLKSLFLIQHLRAPHQQGFNANHDFVESSAAVNDNFPVLGGPRPQPHAFIHPENLVLQMFAGAVPPFRGVNDKQDTNQRDRRGFSWE